jgi:hypothetical protein
LRPSQKERVIVAMVLSACWVRLLPAEGSNFFRVSKDIEARRTIVWRKTFGVQVSSRFWFVLRGRHPVSVAYAKESKVAVDEVADRVVAGRVPCIS